LTTLVGNWFAVEALWSNEPGSAADPLGALRYLGFASKSGFAAAVLVVDAGAHGVGVRGEKFSSGTTSFSARDRWRAQASTGATSVGKN